MIKCLAIDDDPLFLKSLKIFFEEIPTAELTATFSNPVEGIMAVVKTKPDVLLLDFDMPYLDGMDALGSLDQMPKVIMISGHLSSPDTLTIPVDKFITKYDVLKAHNLQAAIEEVMR